MDLVLAIALAALGVALLALPILGFTLSRLRIGGTEVVLSSPIRFRSAGVAALTVAVGVASIAGALLLAGVPDRIAGTSEEQTGLVVVDPDSGRITVRLLIPDSMAGYTVNPDLADGEMSATVDSLLAPLNSVGCLLLRSSGDEAAPGEHYRPPNSANWPRTGYMFCMSHLGVWAFARFDDGVPVYIKPFQEGKSIRKTAPNTFAARMQGDQFVLTINQVEVATVVDGVYPSGAAGLTCGSPAGTTPAAVCHFDGVTAAPLP